MAVQNVGYLFQLSLRKVMYLGYAEEITTFDRFFNKNKSDKAYEEWTGIVGPGVAVEKLRGENMAYKNILVETPKRVLMQTFGLGIQVHMEDVQDDQYAKLSKLADMVGRGHKVVDEIDRANIFNCSFGTYYMTGYDGLALCSTSHTLQGELGYNATFNASTATGVPTRARTTWSNRLATDSDLDYTTLIDAITLMRRQISREGDFYMVKPQTLLVPPELEPTAWEITKSTDRPDTANRGVSSVNRFGISIVSSPYLLDPDAWWLLGDRTDLQWFDRMPFTVRSRDAEGTWDTYVESVHRRGLGIHDPRNIVGTPGA